MPAITINDALLIGVVLASALAAIKGMIVGQAAKAIVPPADPTMAMIGGAIVDRATLADLTKAVVALVAVLERATDDRERALQEKVDAVLKLMEDDHDRRR